MKEYLLVSDFDQTLSFNDSGLILSELLGVPAFAEKIAGLSKICMVQQGGELTYLLLHDPQFRQIRREHLLWPSVSKIPLLSVRQNPTYTAVLTISGADMVPT